MIPKLFVFFTVITLSSLCHAGGDVGIPEYCDRDKNTAVLKVWKYGLKLRRADRALSIDPNCVWEKKGKFYFPLWVDIRSQSSTVPITDRMVILKRKSRPTPDCSDELRLARTVNGVGPGNSDPLRMVAVVKDRTGQRPDNKTLCFDIVVRSVGILDPRARVIDEAGMRQVADLLEAYDVIVDVGGDHTALSAEFEDLLHAEYGLSIEQARKAIRDLDDY